MRLLTILLSSLVLFSCGEYKNENVVPATRNQVSLTYQERPVSVIWANRINTIVPRNEYKVLSNNDVSGIATVVYERGMIISPSDAANIILEATGCSTTATAAGYGQNGSHLNVSMRIYCSA